MKLPAALLLAAALTGAARADEGDLTAALAASARYQPAPGEDPLLTGTFIGRIAAGSLVFVGEDHPVFDLADIRVETAGAQVKAEWVPGSVKWVRAKSGLAMPLARLRVTAPVSPERALLRFRARPVAFQEDAGGASVELFVPLLEDSTLFVETDGKDGGVIRVRAGAAAATPPEDRHAVDHSCSPWNLDIQGLDDVLLAVTCRLTPVGRIGREEPFLEATLQAGGAVIAGRTDHPILIALRDGRPARVALTGPDGKPRVAAIAARLPPRQHRFRLAAGAGPYTLKSDAGSDKKSSAAGSVMLYANLRLRNEGGLSIRAFEAAVSPGPARDPFFNNFGAYFAYDLANVWDGRMRVTALLGMQGITFAPQGLDRKTYDEGVFPQGFEISYFDAFGRRNKTLSGGLFVQPSGAKHYQNMWLRWGGAYFGELNYLSWRSGDRSAKALGVSAGVPIAQLF